MSQTTKRYLISSLVTFFTAFSLAVLPVIDSITLDNLYSGALVGVLFVGARAGVKALLEAFIRPVENPSTQKEDIG